MCVFSAGVRGSDAPGYDPMAVLNKIVRCRALRKKRAALKRQEGEAASLRAVQAASPRVDARVADHEDYAWSPVSPACSCEHVCSPVSQASFEPNVWSRVSPAAGVIGRAKTLSDWSLVYASACTPPLNEALCMAS